MFPTPAASPFFSNKLLASATRHPNSDAKDLVSAAGSQFTKAVSHLGRSLISAKKDLVGLFPSKFDFDKDARPKTNGPMGENYKIPLVRVDNSVQEPLSDSEPPTPTSSSGDGAEDARAARSKLGQTEVKAAMEELNNPEISTKPYEPSEFGKKLNLELGSGILQPASNRYNKFGLTTIKEGSESFKN